MLDKEIGDREIERHFVILDMLDIAAIADIMDITNSHAPANLDEFKTHILVRECAGELAVPPAARGVLIMVGD